MDERSIEPKGSWKPPVYLIGSLLGLVGGLVSAYLYTRTAEENNEGEAPSPIATGDVFRLTLAAVSLLRQISDLAVGKKR